MGKDSLNSYLSPAAEEPEGKFRDARGLSMGSMDEKLRRINEEFKARACVGSGFVFNRNVKLESPANYFGKSKDFSNENGAADGIPKNNSGDVNSTKMRDGFIGGVIPWKVNSSGAMNRSPAHKDISKGSMVGMDLYKKSSIDFSSYGMNKGSVEDSINRGSKVGYVRSIASSSIFNREAPSNSGSFGNRRNRTSPSPFGKKEAQEEDLSVSKSVFSNPLSNASSLSLSSKTSYQGPSFLYTRTGKSPTFAPIDVMYVKSMSKPENTIEKPEGNLKGASHSWSETRNSQMASNLYAPGRKLTIYPQIRISNTVLCYEGSAETTKYYITVESDIKWIICKTIKDISTLFPGIRCATLANAMSPQDRRARDRAIEIALNSEMTDKQLQPFILSDISSTHLLRSSYLLMDKDGWKAYLFKFVGKALICYEKSRVYKIFLLSNCNVLPIGQVGFCLERSGEGVELYTTCEKERDAWVSDIKEYISRL
ncbi:uncharacterized protein Eint_020600 [Encephalitozoon intestinalis ATCC 50506]|uniref:PH domain-containing protein n=1 Tax=Encephalitozoon intestinalis (strain ATCC 50506) TaxID=876142 RepID=E0S5S4_ENCIT|nr:uncharacterized protein Eint_020600 [Encephalitozoon intestinalis ATCC 50506]ADM11059.1 hypothetical protein Eint_020600 [Encephalitozoon intestinalis ATCC 50506]UTX44709.1 hypothetical protein GPK93_02g02260 [Encephalitozoon intestinalis]